MAASNRQSTPYEVTPRIWRDEQPGDEPTLNFSATFVPRDPAVVWQQPKLQSIELVANGQRWTPRTSDLTVLARASFELNASGDATLPAGAKATPTVTFQTAAGIQRVTLVETEITRVD
jgi:hypothetical protein